MKPNLQFNVHSRMVVDFNKSDEFFYSRQEIDLLYELHNQYPEVVATNADDRTKVQAVLAGRYRIDPRVEQALRDALADAAAIVAPITEPTDYELIAYCDEDPYLTVRSDGPCAIPGFTPGRTYEIAVRNFSYDEEFTRKRAEFDEKQQRWRIRNHDCTRSAKDRRIVVVNDRKEEVFFQGNTSLGAPIFASQSNVYSDEMLWMVFEKPVVPTVKEVFPDRYDHAMRTMDTHEVLSEFEYHDGQRDYIARVACKDFGVPAAETGVGKTLVAISLMLIKGAERILVMAPKGTVKGSKGDDGSYDVAQWEAEIEKFAPNLKVHRLFDRRTLNRLRGPDGKLPEGVYITYPDAFLTNGAREHIPEAWDEAKFCKEMGIANPFANLCKPDEFQYGENVGGRMGDITCVARPSMLTLVGHQFDMVVLDEAHLMKNPDSLRTRQFLRLEPKYRYALTATPISNTLPDVFTLMGWTAVTQWGRDGYRNAAWPYALCDRGRFVRRFMARETDHTRAKLHRAKTGKQRSFATPSPHVSNPCSLLKLLKPVMSYIDKARCNPDLVPCEVKEVRVPFGKQQEQLYQHFLDAKNLPSTGYGNILAQQSMLRMVCCDPFAMSRKHTPFPGLVGSNLNPKLLTILDITADRLKRGEQMMIVSSRIGQMDEIERRLAQAGIECSRIDSGPKDNAAEALAFKRGKTPVMLMGINMAQGYSFSNCSNLIIASLEWTFSSKKQAMGRVWRLNSPYAVRVWCVLNAGSIEEVMFDRIATKEDVATLCLYGKRQPHTTEMVDPSLVAAEHIIGYRTPAGAVVSETQCEHQWPLLRDQLATAHSLAA